VIEAKTVAPLARLGDRSLFPTLDCVAYLNHAAISPLSTAVMNAVREAMQQSARDGVGAFMVHLEQRDRLKAKLAKLINARMDELAFVANTTTGVIDVALSLPWEPRDRVVIVGGEFPANVTPWQRATELFDLQLESMPALTRRDDEAQWLARLERVVDGARLLAVSAVQFQTGYCLPLVEIGARCRAHQCELFVDAIQALGIVDIDVDRDSVDYLSAGSHKWLMGPEGIAVLYVRDHCAARLRPHLAGWLSHEDALAFLFEGEGKLRYDRDFKRCAALFEQGIPNSIGAVALEASLDLIKAIETPAIHRHVNAYNDRLETALATLGFNSLRAPAHERRSGILSVTAPDGVDIVDLHRRIEAGGVRCSIPDGRLRFAPHWPNNFDEIPGVVEIIEHALGG